MYAMATGVKSVEGSVPSHPMSSSLIQSLTAMTIRVTCDNCGSVLKIKDELAGTDGKCPKCKTRFVVPRHDAEEAVEESVPEKRAETKSVPPSPTVSAASSPAAKTPSKPAPQTNHKPAKEEEFDPVSFLMDGPQKKPALDPEPEPASRNPKPGAGPGRNSGGGGGFSLDDDDSPPEQEYDKPVAPTRKWGAKKDGSAAGAAERSLDGSKNAAKDLLAKSMEESRIRASEMPEKPPRFNFDFAGFFREVGIKGLGTLVGIIVGVGGVFWMMNSMMGVRVKLPPLGYVSGTVTIAGKPAVGIRVYFSPIDRAIEGTKEKRERARDSLGVTDDAGHFDLYYLPETEGVKVGDCRVWMEANDPTLVIPRTYGPASDHKVVVTSGTNPPQKFEW